MSGTLPSPRRIAGALAVLQALPPAALAVLAERLIDRLDALDAPGMDLEPDNDDCCPAGDDDPASSRPCQGVRGWTGTRATRPQPLEPTECGSGMWMSVTKSV